MKRVLILTFTVLTFFGCRDSPSSSSGNSGTTIITGNIINDFPEFPGPVSDVSLILSNEGIHYTATTSFDGSFEFEVSNDHQNDQYTLSFENTSEESEEVIKRILYDDYAYAFKVDRQKEIHDLGEIVFKKANDAIYVYGEVIKDIPDDEVIVHFVPSTGCNQIVNETVIFAIETTQLNIDHNYFSFPILNTCKELYIYIRSDLHKDTDYILHKLNDLDENGNTDFGSFEIFDKNESAINANVKIDFYFLVNGEKYFFSSKGRGGFDITPPEGSADVYPVINGSVTIPNIRFYPSDDIISIVYYGNHYRFPRTNFSLSDYQIENGEIYLGEFEIASDHVTFVKGKITDPYFNFRGNIEVNFNVNDEYEYFDHSLSKDQIILSLNADNYKNIDTTFFTSNLEKDGEVYLIPEIKLIPTIYEISGKVNLIGVNGEINNSRTVKVAIGRNPYFYSSSLGIYKKLIGNPFQGFDTRYNGPPTQMSFEINPNLNLSHYTREIGILRKQDFSDYRKNITTNLYEIGSEKKQYLTTLQIGDFWRYSLYTSSIDPIWGDYFAKEGQLLWEITEAINDSVFILKQEFKGLSITNCCGETSPRYNEFSSASEYQIIISKERITFELLTEREPVNIIGTFLNNFITNYHSTTFNNTISVKEVAHPGDCGDLSTNQEQADHIFDFKENVGLIGLFEECASIGGGNNRSIELLLLETSQE